MDNENKPVENIHDSLFWDIFSRPDNAAGFLKDFLPESIVGHLDFNYIDINKKSYLSEQYKPHYSDLVIETRFKGKPEEPVFVYFLLEHKSYIPRRPPFQMLRYMVEQWYELEKKDLLKDRLPPVFPILIYQGPKGWTPSTEFQDFINIPSNEMKAYIPSFRYFLNDTTSADEEQFKTSVVIKCWHIIARYLKEPELRDKLPGIVKLLYDFLEQDTALEYLDIFMKYLANTENRITRKDAARAIETILPERGADMIKGWAKEWVEEFIREGEEKGRQEGIQEGIEKGIQEGIERGIEKGIEKGRQEGRQEAYKAMLLEAIVAKYNFISEDMDKKINKIQSTQVIKALLGNIFKTDSLEDFDKLIDKSMGFK
jgi:predicted transposase/invertase (TIGR01784 family)